jgi:rubredoxin
LPGKGRWRRTPFASVPNGTVCPDGKPERPSCLIGYHGSFWAGSGLAAFGSTRAQSETSANTQFKMLPDRMATLESRHEF